MSLNLITEKKVKLFNGKSAKLIFVRSNEDFTITAYADDKEQPVGKLKFFIVSKYKDVNLDDGELPIYFAQKAGTVTIAQGHEYKFDIRDDTLYIGKYPYKLDKKTCVLVNIEVLDKDFLKVGLGSAMLETMEDYAQNIAHCNDISGQFCPNGPFQSATPQFYKKHGYQVVDTFALQKDLGKNKSDDKTKNS